MFNIAPDVPSEIDCNQQQYCNPSGLKIESPGKLKIQFQPTFNGRLYAPGDDAYSDIEFDPNNLQGWRITLREQLKDSTIESQTQRSEFRVVIEHDQVVDHTPSHSEFYRHRTTSFSRAFPLGSESSPAPFELWEGPAIIYIGGDGTEESFNGGLNHILARLFAQKLTDAWGQSVVVENRPGADGVIGSEVIARETPAPRASIPRAFSRDPAASPRAPS